MYRLGKPKQPKHNSVRVICAWETKGRRVGGSCEGLKRGVRGCRRGRYERRGVYRGRYERRGMS